jgi:hypothetical protein
MRIKKFERADNRWVKFVSLEIFQNQWRSKSGTAEGLKYFVGSISP